MPRPDLAALGVQYRRIPVLAIGRDLYCDTRLILEKLEERYPDGALGAKDNDHDGKALEKLLDIWTTDGGVFARAAELIPPDSPLTSDPKFIRDREDFSGRSWAKEDMVRKRGEALAHVKQAFNLLETTLLTDGRRWIRNTEGPSLADIKGKKYFCLLRAYGVRILWGKKRMLNELFFSCSNVGTGLGGRTQGRREPQSHLRKPLCEGLCLDGTIPGENIDCESEDAQAQNGIRCRRPRGSAGCGVCGRGRDRRRNGPSQAPKGPAGRGVANRRGLEPSRYRQPRHAEPE